MSARGLEPSDEAAPVLWGRPVPVLEALVAVADMVREAMRVLLAPADGRMVAEAATELTAAEALDLRLAMTDEAEAAALEAAAEALDATADAADEAEATTEEKLPDPPDRGNWAE
jgi:hypothetical protein